MQPSRAVLSQEATNEAERSWQQRRTQWLWEESGYSHIQETRPQTLAYGLNDSPVGLAGWMVEKFRAWSDCHGEVERVFTKDELLTNVMIYWVTQTINASTRLYYETSHQPDAAFAGRVEVPTGVAVFPDELPAPHVPSQSVSTISNGGPRCKREDTSQHWSSHRHWLRTYAPSSAP